MTPNFVREGGSIPMTNFLEKTLKAPVIHLPLGSPSDKAHLANERISLSHLLKGKNIIRSFLHKLSVKSQPY